MDCTAAVACGDDTFNRSMKSFPHINPTAAGLLPVLVWGASLPIYKTVEERIGLFGFMGFNYAAMCLAGLALRFLFHRPWPKRAVFRQPALYGRWAFFVLHEAMIVTAVALVQPEHLPLVILLNYLWPTMVILCSMLLADVRVHNAWAFVLGTAIVVGSLGLEILGGQRVSGSLLAHHNDVIAYALAVFGAVCWGVYTALSRRDGDRTGGSGVLFLFQGTLALALPFSLLPGAAHWAALTPKTTLLLLGYCILLLVAYEAWDYSARRGRMVVLTLFADTIPWISLLATSMIVHVPVSGRAILSAVLLGVGAYITRYGTTQAKSLEALDHDLSTVTGP